MVEAEVGEKTLKSIHCHGGAAQGQKDLLAIAHRRADFSTPIYVKRVKTQKKERAQLVKRYDPTRRRNLRRGQLTAHGRDVRESSVLKGWISTGSQENRVWSLTEVWILAACLCALRQTRRYGVGLKSKHSTTQVTYWWCSIIMCKFDTLH